MTTEVDDILSTTIAPEIVNERADTYSIFGIELAAFSAQRVAAAFQMGKTYPNVPEADWIVIGQHVVNGEPVDFKVYPQLFQDAVIVLFLCTLPPSSVRAAFRDPEGMLDKAFKWADEHKLTASGDNYSEAVGVFMKIEADIRAVEHTAKPKADATKEDSDPL